MTNNLKKVEENLRYSIKSQKDTDLLDSNVNRAVHFVIGIGNGFVCISDNQLREANFQTYEGTKSL